MATITEQNFLKVGLLFSGKFEEKYRITKTRLFKYIVNFTSKNWKFSDKKLW